MSFGISPVTVLPLPSTSSQYPVRRGSSPFLSSSYAALTNGSTKDSSIALGSDLTPPPSATMSTTYHQQLAAYDSYGNAHVGPFGPASSSSTSAKPIMVDPRNAQHHRVMPQHQLQHQPSSSYSHASTMSQSTNPFSQGSQRSSRPTTPGSQDSSLQASRKAAAEGLIYHSLCIPKCITPKGGNLADFAAQMTCLFWFQDLEDLQFAENIKSYPQDKHVDELKPLARPQENFRKWVYSILSTTQVTQNVILLALLFVYRLKKSTPQIKGRRGSEYRLLTVALMLGNKFLDDNTYTNKTWAEVSSFKVGEIHVMEVEFLSNMRYNLLTSKAEWEDWLTKLACFYEYHERANRPLPSLPRNPSPNRLDYTSPVSSPAASSFYDMPPVTPTGPKHVSPTSSRSQAWNPYMASTTSPLAAKPAMPPTQSRKRSRDDRVEEHPAKRHMPPSVAYSGPPADARLSSRLPAPQLSVNTNHSAAGPQVYSAAPPGYAASQVAVSLPPIQRMTRSTASLYAQSNTHPPSQYTGIVVPAPAGIAYNSVPMGPSQPPSMHGTPSKRRSPGTLAPFASSPLVDAFGVGSAMQTPLALTPVANSPSVYLQHRNSPYKPIRDVRTLLHPGPSASLDQYHLHAPVPPNQMHYQPLGRRYDLRTGIVPEFVRYHLAQQQQQQHPPVITPAAAGHATGYMGQYAP